VSISPAQTTANNCKTAQTQTLLFPSVVDLLYSSLYGDLQQIETVQFDHNYVSTANTEGRHAAIASDENENAFRIK